MSAVAISEMTKVMQETHGNPSSIHGHGRQAGKLLREARQDLAHLLGTKPQHIFFTSGGTESNNTAIIGYCLRHQNRGKHIITTAIEHHSVLETIDYLVQHFGFEATIIQPVNQEITAQQIQEALRDDTILVSTMYANNETGSLLPIAEIGRILKDHPSAYHVDAVQAIGKIPIHPEELGIDFLSASAHKFHGPKGVGFLYASSADFDSYLHGGDQELKKRAGTENLAAIVGMVVALKEDLNDQVEHYQKLSALKATFLEEIADLDYYLNESNHQLPYVVNIGFPGQKNDLLLLRLDLEGISISTGSACTAGIVQTSHVLEAFYGPDSPRLKESVRISLSPLNTEEEHYTLSPTVKKFTLKDNTFFETKVGNFELTRLLEKVPNSGEGFNLKIIINKDLTGAKLNITDKSGLRLVNIFKSEDHHIHQEKFYFLMDSLVERGIFTKEKR